MLEDLFIIWCFFKMIDIAFDILFGFWDRFIDPDDPENHI
jgi:hypothetical protein